MRYSQLQTLQTCLNVETEDKRNKTREIKAIET